MALNPGLFRILIADHLGADGLEVLRLAADVEYAGPFPNRGELLEAAREADALIIRSTTHVDGMLLAAAPRLQVVARAGAGLENIDLDEATRRGVMVLNAPDTNVFAVAEHTFALLLSLARQIPQGVNALQAGEWPRHEMLGFQLHGKRMGIIGFGRLGREVASRAQAFGMEVLASDPYADLSLARLAGVEIVDLEELLRRADILSLHASLTPETSPLLRKEHFDLLKPGAVLVNAMHAALIDESALLEALESGRLAGAALDTFQQEPPGPGHALVRHPHILATPHLNQNTVESQAATSRQIAEDVLAALRGEDYRNIVNLPFSHAAPYLQARPYIDLARRLGKLLGQAADGWINQVEIEVLGEGLDRMVRPLAAVLLAGMLEPVNGRSPNWVSAPVLAFEQGIRTVQAKRLLDLADYPNLVVCRVSWPGGSRTVAGALFANGEARLVHYDGFPVDAVPDGYVLILENDDIPGVIGKVGTRLGIAKINIASWRYGRETIGGRACSFISLDSRPPSALLKQLAQEKEIHSVRLVHL